MIHFIPIKCLPPKFTQGVPTIPKYIKVPYTNYLSMIVKEFYQPHDPISLSSIQ